MSSRRFFSVVIAGAVLLLGGCRSHAAKPEAHVQPVSIRLSSEFQRGTNILRSGPGRVFANVRFIETAEIPEKYDWIHSVAFDAGGRCYRARESRVQRGESGGTRAFGLGQWKKIHPATVDVVFEIPVGTALRRVSVPQEMNLAGIGS